MATLAAAARNAAADAISALLDGGNIQIGTANMASVLATNSLSADAAPAASNGVATLNTISDSTIANSGAAAAARLRSSANADVISGITVGTSGAEINFDSVSFVAGGTCSITSLTLTVPAS
jgi:hypothetical protein